MRGGSRQLRGKQRKNADEKIENRVGELLNRKSEGSKRPCERGERTKQSCSHMEVSFFWLRFDVKGICFCFDGIVGHAVFNIHGADQKKRRERSGEKVFGQTES